MFKGKPDSVVSAEEAAKNSGTASDASARHYRQNLKTNICIFCKNNAKIITAAVISMLVCGIYCALISFRSAPVTEGWDTYYAYLINRGELPYLDFEYLHPPFYIYFAALFTKVFGYGFIAFRILGVFIFSLTALFVTLVFYRVFRREALAAVFGTATAAILQSAPARFFYDNIRLADMFIFISAFAFLGYIMRYRNRALRKIDAGLLVSAVFAVLSAMTYRNSGVIYLLFCVIYLAVSLFSHNSVKQRTVHLLSYLGTCVVMYGALYLLLAVNGLLIPYFKYTFAAAADAGGGIANILFGQFIRLSSKLLGTLPFALLLIAVIFAAVFFRIKTTDGKKPKERAVLMLSLIAVFSVVALLLIFLSPDVSGFLAGGVASDWIYTFFWISLFIFVSAAVFLLLRKKFVWPLSGTADAAEFLFLSGAALTLAYSALVGGSEVPARFALAFTVSGALTAALLQRINIKKYSLRAYGILLSAAFFLLSFSAFSAKLENLYDFNGISSGSYRQQGVYADADIFYGIKMDDASAEVYNVMYSTVMQYTQEGDEIFVAPYMPMLYLMLSRDAATDLPVYWFGECTDASVESDIGLLEEKAPKVIIFCRMSNEVLSVFENKYCGGEESSFRLLQEKIEDYVSDSGYKLFLSGNISVGYSVELYIDDSR